MRASSILVTIDDGHTLFDGPASLNNALPAGWTCCSIKTPPSKPFDSHMSTSSREEADKRADADHHTKLCAWLEEAIDKVRDKWISSQPTRWASLMALHPTHVAEENLVNLVDAQTAGTEIKSAPNRLSQLEGDITLTVEDLLASPYVNYGAKPVIANTASSAWLIPPRSGFLLSDMSKWHNVLAEMGKARDLQCYAPAYHSAVNRLAMGRCYIGSTLAQQVRQTGIGISGDGQLRSIQDQSAGAATQAGSSEAMPRCDMGHKQPQASTIRVRKAIPRLEHISRRRALVGKDHRLRRWRPDRGRGKASMALARTCASPVLRRC